MNPTEIKLFTGANGGTRSRVSREKKLNPAL